MDELLRKVFEKHAHEARFRNTQKNVYTESSVIVLNKKNLSKVRPGMYWYSDDTVSSELLPMKDLKSLVLFVKDDVVYGDSFDQRYLVGANVKSYFRKKANEYSLNGSILYYPKTSDLQTVQESIVKINAACKKLQKLRWSQEVYLAEQTPDQLLSWVDMFDGGEGSMSPSFGAYFRPMITLKMK